MRPNTLADAVESIRAGSPRDVVLAEFVDMFDLANTDQDRYASIEREPKLTGDGRLDALVGAIAEYLAKQRRLGRATEVVSSKRPRTDPAVVPAPSRAGGGRLPRRSRNWGCSRPPRPHCYPRPQATMSN